MKLMDMHIPLYFLYFSYLHFACSVFIFITNLQISIFITKILRQNLTNIENRVQLATKPKSDIEEISVPLFLVSSMNNLK